MTAQTDPAASTTFTARMAFDAYLPAEVTDAQMRVQIKKFTEVIAEAGPDKDDFTILWPYGEASAKSVVHRSFLLIQ